MSEGAMRDEANPEEGAALAVRQVLASHFDSASVASIVAAEVADWLACKGHIADRERLAGGREHLTTSGRFQGDRYPSVPAGKIPLSDRDPLALLPLILYAAMHRAAGKHGDSAFSDDVVDALIAQQGAHAVTDVINTLSSTGLMGHIPAAESVLREISRRAERAARQAEGEV